MTRSDIKTKRGRDTRCYIIGVAYYPNYLRSLVNNIKQLNACFDVSAVVVVLNNPEISLSACSDKLKSIPVTSYVLEHDNTGGEFGGYQAGVDFVSSLGNEAHDCIILNDSLGLHYEFYVEHLNSFVRLAAQDNWPKRIAGRVDQSARLLALGDISGSRWVRSNLMYVDSAALRSIECRIFVPEILDWVNETDNEAFFFGDEVGSNTREHLSKWLFRNPGWYAAAPLSSSNCKKFRFKAQSILQELYLTMRLEQSGTAILDCNLHGNERRLLGLKNGAKRLLKRIGLDRSPMQ